MAAGETKSNAVMVSSMIILGALVIIICVFGVFWYLKAGYGPGWPRQPEKPDLSIEHRMTLIDDALARFYLDCGRFPTRAEGLEALVTAPAALVGKWNGRYLRPHLLMDTWNNPFVYYVVESKPNVGSYDLISLGADGRPGGGGENADIMSKNRRSR